MKTDGPPLWKKAANFTKAVVKHAADGLERLSEDEYEERLAVCQGTDNTPPCAAFNPETAICRDWRCGCSLHKKAWWRSEDCPQGRWPDVSG
jgi:hypothetical protein